MAGNLIWSSGISEQRNVSRSRASGKGGGGAAQTAVSYRYTASFALSFGEGPAEDVLRLWADGKLIYDKTGLHTDVARPGLRFRFHPGSETQLPDPLIEAQGGARAGRRRIAGSAIWSSRICRWPTSATASPTSPPRSPSTGQHSSRTSWPT